MARHTAHTVAASLFLFPSSPYHRCEEGKKNNLATIGNDPSGRINYPYYTGPSPAAVMAMPPSP